MPGYPVKAFKQGASQKLNLIMKFIGVKRRIGAGSKGMLTPY